MQVILAAAGCGQLSEIREIVTKHHQVIIGSMDGSRLNRQAPPGYFKY